MCILRVLTFSCSHIEYNLLEHCEHSHGSPEGHFCLAGTTELRHSDSPVPCQEDCPRVVVHSVLEGQRNDAFAKIAKVSERAESVKQSVVKSKGKTPKAAHLSKLKEKGWDTAMLEGLCEASMSEVKTLLEEYEKTRETLVEELDGMYAEVKASVREFTPTSRDDGTQGFMSFDGIAIRDFGVQAHDQLYDSVCEIERRASEACLERFGWSVPEEDKVQAELIAELSLWKQGVATMTRMSDAFVGEDRIDEGFEGM
ncbi:hypothetical protein P280DRAFT_204516 [Massarina eburnea CBS 473.64]|uniref:Uncharacterized protein n=1 Tax=Massarina eburnea CBS 473.64 TaxID=1395130 RepID=A0A6A6RHU3_9PLEO|nr:hypothetical protein P280DRAFT_204516 [Massarina eburnea CBS 473.64]